MGRKQLDPPPRAGLPQGCPACSILSVWVWLFFPKKLAPGAPAQPAGHPEGTIRGGCKGFSCSRRLQDGPSWPPRRLEWPEVVSKFAQDGPKWPPRRPRK
eukprot:9503111-Pyramimonas_sp.AAC.1